MKNEEKQALIERCEQKIKELKKVQFGIMHKDKLDLLIYCQALAALTAQPVKLPDFNGLDQLAGKFLQNAISSGGKVSAAYTECAHLLATEVKAIRQQGYEVQE